MNEYVLSEKIEGFLPPSWTNNVVWNSDVIILQLRKSGDIFVRCSVPINSKMSIIAEQKKLYEINIFVVDKSY